MDKSGIIELGNNLQFRWEQERQADGTSKINWNFYNNGAAKYFGSGHGTQCYIVDFNTTNRKIVYFETEWIYYANSVIKSGSNTVAHNADGSLTLSIYAAISAGSTDYNSLYSGSAVVELTAVVGHAEITTAENFTDEGIPYMAFSYTNGTMPEELHAWLVIDGVRLIYRQLTVGVTGYAFRLTDAERDSIRQTLPNKTSADAEYILQSVSGAETFQSTTTKVLNIINAEPVLTPTIVDTNARTIELTGDNRVMVKYFSNAAYTIGAEAQKYSTITSQYVTCGSQTLTTATGTIEGVESNTFYFGATDTRGLTTRDFRTRDLVPYTKLTCKLQTEAITGDGTLSIRVSGNFYNDSFGAKNNTLEIEYGIRENDGDIQWVIISAQPSTYENTYSLDYDITGLNYQSEYTLIVNAIDELMSVQTDAVRVASSPVFDWGRSDFKHHTNVYLDNNKTLRSYMTDGTDIQIMGVNSANNTVVGWGGYDTSAGSTYIYGTNVGFNTRNNVLINGKVVADFVTEDGTNGTWHYRKWASGRVELDGYQNIGSIACNTALGNWYRTAVQTAPAFPITVNNPKTVVSYESAGYGALVWFTTLATSSKPADYYLIRPTSSTAITGVVHFYVTGTWK